MTVARVVAKVIKFQPDPGKLTELWAYKQTNRQDIAVIIKDCLGNHYIYVSVSVLFHIPRS